MTAYLAMKNIEREEAARRREQRDNRKNERVYEEEQ